jgi:hypothetical protein
MSSLRLRIDTQACGSCTKQNAATEAHYGQLQKFDLDAASTYSKAGWSWGCVSAVDCRGLTIWIADAHRGDGNRFIVHADEKLTAFLELERAVCVGLLTEQI